MPTLELLWWETVQQLPPLHASTWEKSERWVSYSLPAPLAPAPKDRWGFMRPETAAKLRGQTCPARER
jgi:hypothetical protein